MAQPHRQWLAAQILSDQQTVSYRILARVLKVHVNSAKRMLFDFYSHENAKRPGSIHATYLLSGRRKSKQPTELSNGNNGFKEDSPVPSSPPPFSSSMLDPSQEDKSRDSELVQTITLAREESLEAVKSSFETITSIHIYSLSPHRISDLQTLLEPSRHIYTTYFAKEDPLEHNKTYGVILNKNVKRRTIRRPAPAAIEPKQVGKVGLAKKPGKAPEKAAVAAPAPLKRQDTISRPSSAGSSTPTSTTGKPPGLKRDMSDIFKAFSKNKTKTVSTSVPTLSRNNTDSSMGNTSAQDKSTPAHASSDEGDSDDSALLAKDKKRSGAKKRASTGKAEREAKLRKMMDESDEEMGDAPKPASVEKAKAAKTNQKTAAEGPAEVDWSDSDSEKKKKQNPHPSQPASSKASIKNESEAEAETDATGPRRRRGKRKVMKKRTTKDEDGYLVTREEAVWESFSEEDPNPVRAKVGGAKPGGVGKGGAGAGGKKGKAGAGAGGGKNIMAFFGKK